MTIEVNSAGWTGQDPDDARPAAPQVCGEFSDRDQLNEAVSRLAGSIFDRSQISVRVPGRENEDTYAGSETPMGEDDARNFRTLTTSTAAAGLAMGAAGVVIATGGAALPAVAAAAAAGGATIAAGEAAGGAMAPGGQTEQQRAAEQGSVILMVNANTPERQAKAEELMRACGATRIWRQDHA